MWRVDGWWKKRNRRTNSKGNKEKFALPKEPDRFFELKVRKGAILRKSKVGGNSFGKGGGVQYYLQENSFSRVDFENVSTMKF